MNLWAPRMLVTIKIVDNTYITEFTDKGRATIHLLKM